MTALRTVIVCGSREGFSPEPELEHALRLARSEWHFEHVVVGSLRGVDRLAFWWAQRLCITSTVVPAKWREQGNPAGPIRNRLMLHVFAPMVVLAFPGGKGTRDMVEAAGVAKVPARAWDGAEWKAVEPC